MPNLPTLSKTPRLSLRKLRRVDEARWVDAAVLNVKPELQGLPLASPWRRAWAMGVDLLCVALLSGIEGPWLLLGLLLVALLVRSKGEVMGKRQWAGWLVVALLVWLAAGEAFTDLARGFRDSETPAAAAAAAVEPAASSLATAASAAAAAASAAPLTDAQRIAELEAEVARLKKPKPWKWREAFDSALEDVGVSLGWGIVYFSLLPVWWNGQTVGKRLFKLRTVELTGQPLTVMRSLRRYGGYAAGMATGGLGFLQALWDANRQGVQDRVAHTVVVDLRAASLPLPGAALPTESPVAPSMEPVPDLRPPHPEVPNTGPPQQG